MGMSTEAAVSFPCNGAALFGILHTPSLMKNVGVIVIVGGPQYRAGSHRQFVILARAISAMGYPVLRFDYRGMGDSEGEIGQGEACELIGADIHAAIAFMSQTHPKLVGVVLIGLCDGATAAALNGLLCSEVLGLALLNPWLGQDQPTSSTYLRHYYLRKLFSPELIRRALKGELRWRASGRELVLHCRNILSRAAGSRCQAPEIQAAESVPISIRFAELFRRFNGEILIILSEKDLIAADFLEWFLAQKNAKSSVMRQQVKVVTLEGADHTFSSTIHGVKMCEAVVGWLCSSSFADQTSGADATW